VTEKSPATIVASAGVGTSGGYADLVPPLHASDTFCWDDSDAKPPYDYSRTVNPTRDLLTKALAELEGAAGGAVTGSGQSAALLALLQLGPGALVVAPHDCYGGTYRLLCGLQEKGLIRPLFVDQGDDEAYAAALEQGPALVWLETPSNPLLRIVDIPDRAAKAKAAGALSLADNTLMTPLRQQPLRLGCDYVLHSTTKAINGHADLFGGALLCARPEQVEQLHWWANAAGLNASAQDCWATLRGLRTLQLRVARQEATAAALAEWLAGQERVHELRFPGLAGFPGAEIVARQQRGPGFMLSFRLKGGEEAAARFVGALQLVKLASSLGGFATLICKPSTMTHRGMPPEAQAEAGIHPDLLRLSVGLEEPGDLIADLARGIAAI
jgi:cystathionine gamma-synthase